MSLPEFSEYFCGEVRSRLLFILELSLSEDGVDVTSDSIFSQSDRVEAIIVAKSQTVISGLPVIPLVMNLCASRPEELTYSWQALSKEGEEVSPNTIVAQVNGPTRQILRAERIILNFIGHLSGIATLTKRYVNALQGSGIRLLDTRKTLPAMRYPEKYAVLCGGGFNHRRNLSELVMIKDNHIDAAGSIVAAVTAVRQHCNPCPPIEVECRILDEVREAVDCHVDRIMFDNMTPEAIAESLRLVPHTIETEVSGGIDLETIRNVRIPGNRQPDFVSVGRLTHSAPSADFSMRIAKEYA